MQWESYQNFASQLIRCYWKSTVNKVQGGRDCWLGSEETLSGWSSIWNKPWRRKLLQCNWILSRFVVDSGLTLGSKAEAEDVLDDLWYSDSPQEWEPDTSLRASKEATVLSLYHRPHLNLSLGFLGRLLGAGSMQDDSPLSWWSTARRALLPLSSQVRGVSPERSICVDGSCF